MTERVSSASAEARGRSASRRYLAARRTRRSSSAGPRRSKPCAATSPRPVSRRGRRSLRQTSSPTSTQGHTVRSTSCSATHRSPTLVLPRPPWVMTRCDQRSLRAGSSSCAPTANTCPRSRTPYTSRASRRSARRSSYSCGTLTHLREGDIDIQFLVERLEALVVNARKVPMTNNVMLEQAAMLDLIDQLRIAIPEEVKQARRINQESDRVISKAREEAEGIIGAAQEQAALLLQDQSILREAESRAQAIIDNTQTKADETMRGADQYAADVLVRLESDLVKTLSVIKKSLEVLEERRAQPTEGETREGERRAVT